MEKVNGGMVVRWTTGMPRVRLRPEVIAAIRSGTMDESWYGEVVDQCFRGAREKAIENLRNAVAYEIRSLDVVVDRRPTRLRLAVDALKEALAK